MDLTDIREILELIEEKDIVEFELEADGIKLRVRKAAHAPAQAAAPGLPAQVSAAAASSVAVPVAAPAPAAAADAEPEAGLVAVKSPIVGTFYRSPDPNSPVFVNVGDRVRVGQVLCIIEAMKLMNEIEAELAGEITRIHPENGQPVQYGDPLFTIRADR